MVPPAGVQCDYWATAEAAEVADILHLSLHLLVTGSSLGRGHGACLSCHTRSTAANRGRELSASHAEHIDLQTLGSGVCVRRCCQQHPQTSIS